MSRQIKLLLILGFYVAALHAEAEHFSPFSANVAEGILTVGGDCSESSPCNARFGNTVHTFKTAATIKPVGTTSGLVFVYLDRSGGLIAGSKSNLTCQNCLYRANITQFPTDSIPLYTWTLVAGKFDPNSKADFRAVLSTTSLIAGNGIEISESAGTATVGVDTTLIPIRVLDVPKSSQAPCSAGQFSFDANYYYVCVAPSKWKRVALQDF